jgi:hypothetical protein
LGSLALAVLFYYRKGQKKQAFGNFNLNLNVNRFSGALLYIALLYITLLADARGSFSLQRRTEKTEKIQKLLAGARLCFFQR